MLSEDTLLVRLQTAKKLHTVMDQEHVWLSLITPKLEVGIKMRELVIQTQLIGY